MKLFIVNLPYETTEPEIRGIFTPFEPILDFSRPLDRETGKPRGFAFVTLADDATGTAAIAALDGVQLGGRTLKVNEAESRQRPHRPQNPERFQEWDDSDRKDHSPQRRTDDRPLGKDGKPVVYKGI